MEDRLIKLVRLVDAGSFTRAAQELHLSQPALTAAIRKLERELGATLLLRSRQGVSLTAAGDIAYASGQAVLTQAKNLQRELASLRAQKVPLDLGIIDSIAEALFVHHDELRTLEQWAHVSLSINNSARLLQDVLQHRLDLAIIVEPATVPKLLSARPLGIEPLVVVTRADQLPHVQTFIRTGKLPHFLSYNQNSQTHALLLRTAQARGVELEPSFYSTSPDIILQLVLAGRGTAALPYLKVEHHLKKGTLRPVRLGKSCLVERRIVSVQYSAGRLPPQLTSTFKRGEQLLKELLRQAKQL